MARRRRCRRSRDREAVRAAAAAMLQVMDDAIATAPSDRDPSDDLGRMMNDQLRRRPRGRPWRIAAGRPTPAAVLGARALDWPEEPLPAAG